ncbi:hypothetical protein ACQKEF_09355 [Pseudomonas oryzihabitans]|nr:hypothetical protein [Pseudomonas aeruginosa]
MLNLKHEVLLRLRAIELIAFWEGRLITTHVGADGKLTHPAD